MPEVFLEEINRWNKMDPGTSSKEYVQWQRGPKSSTSMELMTSWIDTCLKHDNIWLVLVFHGIDGIGYQPKTSGEIKEYFNYMKAKEDELWIATFRDVTKYIRERMNTAVNSSINDDKITILLSHSLDPEIYTLPLTLKTSLPPEWETIKVKQGDNIQYPQINRDADIPYVLYQATPNAEPIELMK